MSKDDNKLNLPAIRKGGGLSQPKKTGISSLDLSKKSSVNSILKSDTQSVKQNVLQAERGLDLVLVGDLTGSMGSYHSLLKRKFVDLANNLFPLIQNLRVGIIFYLDHGSGDPYVTRIQKLTTNTQDLVRFIDETVTGNGGDADEAVEDALNDLLSNMNWKESNSYSVVLFGDARPHLSHNCPHRYDFFDLTKKLYQKGVTINSVYCDRYQQERLQQLEDVNVGDFTRNIGHPSDANFFSWIANVTGGMVIGIDNIEDLVDIIRASAAKDSGRLDDLEKEMKSKSPSKLKLIDVARKAEKRKRLGGSERKGLSM
ncbi:MAG: VWA domain-containing protein [Flavobacteriales bacterium]|nr:VWA domain-containing protein [Flavobacteriales bacterium]